MAKLLDRPTSVLLERALALWREDFDSDEWWDVFYSLSARGDDETFDAAKNWCASTDASERELAANLLNQFGEAIISKEEGSTSFPSADRVVPVLEKLIDDPEPGVIATVIIGLGWYSAYDAILARPSLAAHASPRVRFAVACGLMYSESKAAIDMLIVVSNDADDDVRDMAIWGLGCESRLDTPEIREALVQRIDDPDADVRGEAAPNL